ncbi:uncharacterized protein K444DRAFT_302289 [Hyaloscypha bicolor E]|uniref:Uncharacterized protein n=1 Tax=Hyaloscypha bicolor E TaxID=1095630 RepID=A0A2J6TN71_9HELO|nr:uncharacterized protein K444DRAFT_302289 [Hyaloscypha bicolor E]PMD64481.1 hypothetical protein K444DRAFT_302289 [Hyaloscypha bicolor E]
MRAHMTSHMTRKFAVQLFRHWNLSKNAKNSASLPSHTNFLIGPSPKPPKRSVSLPFNIPIQYSHFPPYAPFSTNVSIPPIPSIPIPPI